MHLVLFGMKKNLFKTVTESLIYQTLLITRKNLNSHPK